MIIRSEDFRLVCSKILGAVDSNSLSTLTEVVELKTEGTNLFISVTNKDYFARVKLDLGIPEPFHATVNADLFLKLVSQITTETIELNVRDNCMILKANGTYKIPLVYYNEQLIELPEITINNVTNEFNIDSNILLSILQYNSKELNKGVITKPVQKLYYIDDQGALTFTSNGGCVNSFMLEQPVKILLPNRVVKLFKLFKGENVKFTLGYDAISEETIQTKVRFESSDICITAVISCDDTLLNSVPVGAIRNRANAEYPYTVAFNKEAFLQAINRLMLFSPKDGINLFSKFEFKRDCLVMYDVRNENKEEIYYTGNTIPDEYSATLDFGDLKTTLETCTEPYLTLHFGNGVAMVIARGNIKNIISEAHPMT